MLSLSCSNPNTNPIILSVRIKEWEAAQITKFKDSDYMTAMMKLKDAAFRWDPSNHIDSLFTQGFEAFLTPYQFKQQIDKSFGIKLTGAEVKALFQFISGLFSHN